MEARGENTVATSVIYPNGLDSRIDKDRFRDETLYQATMGMIRKLYFDGTISEAEYDEMERCFREKYKPVLGGLFADVEKDERGRYG